MSRVVELIGKALRSPPHVVADRAYAEAKLRWEAFRIPRAGSGLELGDVLRDTRTTSLDALRSAIMQRPYVASFADVDRAALDELSPGETERLRARADAALRHEVDLLGSGPIALGDAIDWHRDYKTGRRWPPGFFGAIKYGQPPGGSDVKVPWEISRMQWLLPVAQMYVLTKDDRYAAAVRDAIEQWIAENPYGGSVNWTCTMDVALRILTWTFFYRALHASSSWSDAAFQQRFLLSLYEHGHFTAGHLEVSSVNGNHYTADAAGLVFAGAFFGGSGRSAEWLDEGWRILEAELPRQVSTDGVDFEASVPYHRLVLELFFLPSLYRKRLGLDMSVAYRERIQEMARFVAAYTPSHGEAPMLGDADDARALPFGTQPLNDHRYLVGQVGLAFDSQPLLDATAGARAESAWLHGASKARTLPARDEAPAVASSAFREAGYYVMRSAKSHVFIDCAPVGLGGRGGHGHNDCLSFSATIAGVPVVVDRGAYVYTASYADRNAYRATASHNTPQIDDEEINRFISPTHLWNLHFDALPEVRDWQSSATTDRFVGSHAGYRRLAEPVTPVRTIALDKEHDTLTVTDAFEGTGSHRISIPWYLDAQVQVRAEAASRIALTRLGRRFSLEWQGDGWTVDVEPTRVSPSYGVTRESSRVVWRREGPLSPLTVVLRSE